MAKNIDGTYFNGKCDRFDWQVMRKNFHRLSFSLEKY